LIEAYKRMSAKIGNEFLNIQQELLEIEKIKTVDIDIIDEVLSITRDIASAYKRADIRRKKEAESVILRSS